MASKTGESSSAQASSDALYCKWGTISFNNLVQEYDIKLEWNPVLPSKQDTTFPLKHGKITLFMYFFKFCNFRLPITKFCKSVLDEYPIHISQLHPLGLVKLCQFEFACIALGHIPEITVFRAFSFLCGNPPFFTFDRRYIGVSCLRYIPASSRDKDWKKKFFYIDASVIPGEMHWREMGAKEKLKDDGPPADAYVENTLFKRLSQCPSECTVIPEGGLVMEKMSLLWRNSRLYPTFKRLDEGQWSIFDFVDPPPPRNAALMSTDRAVGDQDPDVLKIHIDRFLLPVMPADFTAYVSQPPPSRGGGASIEGTKKPYRIRIPGKKIITAGATASPAAVSISTAPGVLLLLPPLPVW
ncbi:hypothetical protein Hanom_Chr12g01137681 [Helianthus anomalus]